MYWGMEDSSKGSPAEHVGRRRVSLRRETLPRCFISCRGKLVDTVEIDERVVVVEERDDHRRVIDLVGRQRGVRGVHALAASGFGAVVRGAHEKPERPLPRREVALAEHAIDFVAAEE